jgi:hypothetical protein
VAVTLILAHQGGWDETLLVLAPLVLIGLLLKLANRRAQRLLADQRAAADSPGGGRADPAASSPTAGPELPPNAAPER